jgi:P27 family predicted phage terminase small subunit
MSKPTAILESEGKPISRTIPGTKQTLKEAMPRTLQSLNAPEALSEKAALVWDAIIADLEVGGVVSAVDDLALQRYCEMTVEYHRARDFLNSKPSQCYELFDSEGRLRYRQQSPEVSIMRGLADKLLKLETEFGMTPAGRTRINAKLADALNRPSQSPAVGGVSSDSEEKNPWIYDD